MQNYLQAGKSVSYFDLAEQRRHRYVSDRLQELSGYYSNRMSYEEVARLVERVTGEAVLSDQTIWQIVRDKAIEVSENLKEEVEKISEKGVELPRVNS
jgi:hypothetical protein